MRRYLKSKRAISGAVTALILVIVSVALALAVAVFAFGLFGTFGSSGQVQAIGTPELNVTQPSAGQYNIYLIVQIKNSGTVAASVQSVTIGNITVTPASTSPTLKVTPTSIPGGFDGILNITIKDVTYLPGVLQKNNIGGSVPVSITFSEGSLSPTLTLQGVLNDTVTG
ncbi:hypothetical protein [Metallosphaera sedula]|uniref:hypothetical protein n=1 Tax=Metallosphaera sedula TaxID=43687 RepID=UPI0020C04D61|nr:hypothetical protein [Metallosphaera sedula]BBL46862.1 hypothetical protein MJ1HA_0963 [Metallosphaera sedula]